MSFGFGPVNTKSAFLQQDVIIPEDYQRMRDVLEERENRTANCLNIREIGQYQTVEILNSQTWFSTNNSSTGQSQQVRYGYRRTFDLVELNDGPITAGATTLRVSPPITAMVVPTRAFGAGTIAGPQYVFFPSANVDVVFDNTTPNQQTITITNTLGSDMTQCYVTIEYLKQS